MRKRQRFPVYVLAGFLAGCSPAPAPVFVTAPESTTLQSLAGKPVTLEGSVAIVKAGLVLRTSGPTITLEYWGAEKDSWPKPGDYVQVTGILRGLEPDGGAPTTLPGQLHMWPYAFRLESPESRAVDKPAR